MAVFGYDTGDLTQNHTIHGYIKGYGFVSPATNGTGTKISVRLKGWGSGENCKCCLYYNDSGTYRKVTNGETEELDTGSSDGDWVDFNFISSPTVLSAVGYIICVRASNLCDAYRNTGGGSNSYFYKAILYGAWADPQALTKFDGLDIDIYCTYTEGGTEHTHSASDTLSISDSMSPSMIFGHAAGDTMNISDVIAGVMEYKHSVADTLSISDSVIEQMAYVYATSDTMQISDAMVYQLIKLGVIKRPFNYGLRPARINRPGRIGL